MKKEKNSLYYFLKVIYTSLMNFLYRPKFLGKENIPQDEAFIFAGNHRHAFDPLLVLMSTNKVVHYLAKEELFKGLHGKILKKIGIIKVSRVKSNPLAVKEAVSILENGGIVGLFPEGTRNKTDEELLKFRFGAVSMAKKANVKIVPFAIKGKYKLFKKDIAIEFGIPIDVNDLEMAEANTYLRNKVLELLRK